MRDRLSAEARDDAEEESPRVFAIAIGLKEIERARVSVEKGEVKEMEFEKKGQWEHEVSQPPLGKAKELNTNRKKTVSLAQVDKQWPYLFLVPVLAVSCSVGQ